MEEGIYCYTTILKKSRVKSWYLTIIETRKFFNSMGPSKKVNSLKDSIVNGIVIMIG